MQKRTQTGKERVKNSGDGRRTARQWRMGVAVLAWLVGLAVLGGCEQDAYDKGEGRYSLMRADFVEAYTNADNRVDYVLTDDGDSLPVVKPFAVKWMPTADSVYRALLYYNKVEGRAEAISVARVGVASISEPAKFEDGVKTDPVKFESAWVSKNGRYANFSILLMTGSADDEEAIHTLAVIGDSLVDHPDGTRTWHLRLYHDQGGMPEYYSQRTYFSIPLQNCDADSMRMTISTYDGVLTRTLPVR